VRSWGLLFSLCDPQRTGTKKSRRAWKLQRLVLAPRGLTGLLNPLSIWHKIISVVFHELFQLYFIPARGALMRVNIWIVRAFLLALLAITRFAILRSQRTDLVTEILAKTPHWPDASSGQQQLAIPEKP